jgi:hypothetical protein
MDGRAEDKWQSLSNSTWKMHGIYLPYNTIGTFTHDIDNIVLVTSIEVFQSSNYFFSSTRCHLVKKKGGSGEERGGKSVSKILSPICRKTASRRSSIFRIF